MIVISRRKLESITIGDHLKVIVVEVRGDKVRLGIDSPQGTSIERHEISDVIQPPPGLQRREVENGLAELQRELASTEVARNAAERNLETLQRERTRLEERRRELQREVADKEHELARLRAAEANAGFP